ncbi:hypothetical protein ACOMHN_034629 [Nucella lapillus]
MGTDLVIQVERKEGEEEEEEEEEKEEEKEEEAVGEVVDMAVVQCSGAAVSICADIQGYTGQQNKKMVRYVGWSRLRPN